MMAVISSLLAAVFALIALLICLVLVIRRRNEDTGTKVSSTEQFGGFSGARNDPLAAAPRSSPVPSTPEVPVWVRRLPPKILFVDCETTGLYHADRPVTFAGIVLETGPMAESMLRYRWVHFPVDCGVRSHPVAEQIHGFDDWFIRHQQPFVEAATVIRGMFEEAGVIVAHNAEFDHRMLSQAFSDIGQTLSSRPWECTMEAYREEYPRAKAGLDAALRRLRLKRSSERHGALEDAWFCMQVWLHLNTPLAPSFPDNMDLGFTYTREVPVRPEGALPRRKPRRKKPVDGEV